MVTESEFKRIYWASRRGMLELDLMMVPYVEGRFRELDDARQQHYIRLLECEDTELFSWLLGREDPADPDLLGMVNDIKAFAKSAAT